MPPVATTAPAPMRYMQGIAVPPESVRPPEFFDKTRRHFQPEAQRNFAGLGQQDVVEIKKSDIVAGIKITFAGTLTITGAGVSSTARWPYDLIRQLRFTANGQSNIINVSGLKLKAREFMARGDRTDRGVEQVLGGVTRRQGTLASASESWGVGSAGAVAAGAYDVQLMFWVPVCDDEVDLAGAIFAATSTTDLNLTIDWETVGNLFTGYAAGTPPTLTGQLVVESLKYSIPQGGDGSIVIPDLSVFHSLVQTRASGSLAVGDNEPRIIGQGAGKSLLRAFFQVWNGAGVGAPLAMNATNFSRQAWRYAGNETPDEYATGQVLRMMNERMYSTDIGGLWGFGSHEFAYENAFRDVVDMGTTSELRLLVGIQNGVALVSPAIEYVVETIYKAGAGA